MRRARGFTLIELLVVIGIIAVLVGILLPTISAVRNAAHKASTTAELGRIASGINAYYTDFHAYPGPIGENDVDGGGTPSSIGTIAPTNITAVTSSENLVLGLLGGLTATRPAGILTAWQYDPTAVTKGPQSLNAISGKQYGAYVDVTQDELSPQDNTGNYIVFASGASVHDTNIPEFLDHIPGPIINPNDGFISDMHYQNGAILYLRCRVGASGGNGIEDFSGASSPPAPYQFAQLSPYDFTQVSPTDFPVPTGSPPTYTSETIYFQNPNISGQPISKDSFILISAGIDHVYGTKDDIIYSN